MSGSPLRVGVVGAGGIAQVSHLPAYRRLGDARVTAVCDVDRGKARRVADRYHIPRVADTWEDLVGADDVDAVDICVPNHLHAEVAVGALRAGKHVLCEKPFTRGTAEAAEVVAEAGAADRVLMAGFNNRYREDVRLLRAFVERGDLGRLFYVKAGWLMRSATWTGEAWKRSREQAGGGALLDLGIQVLDLALWLGGMPAVLSVNASAHPLPQGDRVESTASALLRLENDAALSLEVSWGLQPDSDVTYLNLFGDAGAARLHPLRLHRGSGGGLQDVTPAMGSPRDAYRHSYESEIRHFVECARTGERSRSPGDDALAVHAVLEALYRSVSEGREVSLS